MVYYKRVIDPKEKIHMIKTSSGEKRFLKAEEIECRFGQKSKDGSRYSVLLYKTARTDMDILDEIYGPENWQVKHYEVKGKDFCSIGVRIKRSDNDFEWIWKSDCGKDFQRVAEDTEKKGLNEYEKSESSDAFKRAGFCWGIGRELYSAPQIWLSKDINPFALFVEKIGYNSAGDIDSLVISAIEKDKVTHVFTMNAGKSENDETGIPTDVQVKNDLIKRIRELKGDEQALIEYFKVEKLEDLGIDQLRRIVKVGEERGKV